MKKYLNRRSIMIFLLVFVSVTIALCGSMSSIYLTTRAREKADYTYILQSEMDRAYSYVEQSLLAGVQTANSIYAALWYRHYRNVTGYYDNEFGGMMHSELVNDLNRRISLLSLFSEIAVITPSLNSVISNKGWYTLPMYQHVYPTVHIDTSEGTRHEPKITSDSHNAIITVSDMSIRQDKSIICLFVDEDTLISELSSMLGVYGVSFSIDLNGQTISHTTAQEEHTVTLTRTYQGLPFTLSISYIDYEFTLQSSSRLIFILLLFTMVIAALLLSMLITVISVKPVNEMVLSFGGQESDLDDPCRFIYQYVNEFSRRGTLLSEENNSLRDARRHFIGLMRNEIIFSMLNNKDFDFNADYLYTAFPWIHSGRPFLIAACRNLRGNHAIHIDTLCPMCDHASYALSGQESWCLFYFENEHLLEEGRICLTDALQTIHFTLSDTLYSPEQIYETHLLMRGQLDTLQAEWQQLPMLLQTRLVGKIRASHREEAIQVLTEACSMYNPESVLWVLMRLSAECGFEASDYPDHYHRLNRDEQAQLTVLCEYVTDLCRYITSERTSSNAVPDYSADICKYIAAHFDDAELSVNQLSDMFSVHRTLISRAVKQETGETFSDYLLRLRTNKAAELLRATTDPIAQIGERVGLPNYLTFKRAFTKVYHLSPKEWRDMP